MPRTTKHPPATGEPPARAPLALARLEHLGISFHCLTPADLGRILARAIDRGERTTIAHHNLHSAFLCRRDARMRRFHAGAEFAHVDGMALVFSARLVGLPIRRAHRVTYADWIWPLAGEAASRGWRIFHLGGAPGVAARAARVLGERYPGLQMDTRHGYFDARPGAAENLQILEQIAEHRPDILMVGMGMPRQEHWILDNLERLPAAVILPCGACMDYVAGVVPIPPRWMGRIGLEWLFRLAREPTRLAKRYLVEPLFLIGPLGRELFARRILGRGGRQTGRGN